MPWQESIGYFFIDVVREQISAWLNPWADPSGHGYQIVQSLLAIANGGMIGRGPGLGSPTLVPVAHSDFIFTAIAEETGLLGTTALIIIFALILAAWLAHRVSRTGSISPRPRRWSFRIFRIQTLLIIDGNLRLLPLTGVTLPFVSYGGSSLLTAFVALGLSAYHKQPGGEQARRINNTAPILFCDWHIGIWHRRHFACKFMVGSFTRPRSTNAY